MHMKQKLGQDPNVSSPSKNITGTHSLIFFGSRSFKNDSICFNICLMQRLVSATCSTRLLVFDQLAMSDSPSCAPKILRAPKRPHALNLQNTCRSCRTNYEIKRNYVMFFE